MVVFFLCRLSSAHRCVSNVVRGYGTVIILSSIYCFDCHRFLFEIFRALKTSRFGAYTVAYLILLFCLNHRLYSLGCRTLTVAVVRETELSSTGTSSGIGLRHLQVVVSLPLRFYRERCLKSSCCYKSYTWFIFHDHVIIS